MSAKKNRHRSVTNYSQFTDNKRTLLNPCAVAKTSPNGSMSNLYVCTPYTLEMDGPIVKNPGNTQKKNGGMLWVRGDSLIQCITEVVTNHETSLMKFLLREMPASASKIELNDVVKKSDETTASSV